MPRVGNQNVDSNNPSRKHSTPLHTKSIGKAPKSCGKEHDYISLLEKFFRDQKASF